MTPIDTTQSLKPRIDRNGVRLFAGMTFFIAAQAAVLFIVAGTMRWPAAWAYLGLTILCYAVGLAWVASVNPAVINERGRRSSNTEDFDRRFHRIMPLIVFGAPAIGGLDHRFGWSAVPVALQVAGLVLMIPALATAVWVLATNAFAARVVRMQEGHQVVTTGPYRFVRHPMYSGTLLVLFASALALGSWWMLIPAALGTVLFVWRTAQEDATLIEKLPGYREYARQTLYRLIPGIW